MNSRICRKDPVAVRLAHAGRGALPLVLFAMLAGGCSDGGSSDPAATGSEPSEPASPPNESAPSEPSPPEGGSSQATSPEPPPPELVARLSLDTDFYAQYLDADGIPIVASAAVVPFALAEARWVLGNMLVNREDLASTIASSQVRVSIMAVDEFTTDIPEHSDLRPREYWDRRARGLGATETRPAVSTGEENLLDLAGDPYRGENILVHEFAHVIHEQGMRRLDPGFDARLAAIFEQARTEGLWQGTYADTNRAEYFAEGVQSWFDTNRQNDPEHNDIDTRDELAAHDPRLAALVAELFGDVTWRYELPSEREGGSPHLAGFDRGAAPVFVWPPDIADVDISQGPGPVRVPLENRVSEDGSGSVSPEGGGMASIVFDNRTAGEVRPYWIDFGGERVGYAPIAAGEQLSVASFQGHRWEIADSSGQMIGRFEVADEDGVAVLVD